MDMKLQNKLAIIGCAHSATLYTARVFQQLGLDITHDDEKIGSDGIVSWAFAHYLTEDLFTHQFPTNDGYYLPPGSLIVQQVRHPLKVIASMCATVGEKMWTDIGYRANYREIDWKPMDDPVPLRGMRYWLLWNLMAGELATYSYRIEDFPEVFPRILEMIGVPPAPLPSQPTNTNVHNLELSYTWTDLDRADGCLCYAIRSMAKQFGYEIE